MFGYSCSFMTLNVANEQMLLDNIKLKLETNSMITYLIMEL